MKKGDKVEYRSSIFNSRENRCEVVVKAGVIEEVFPSMDGTFQCFWITEERHLITEGQIIRVLSD